MNIVASAVWLDVGDAAASSLFFTTHLGFREVVVGDEFVVLGRDDAAADILLREYGPELPHRITGVVVSFAVTGIEAEHERLRREGANITVPLRHEPWGEWLLQLTDPNGVVVQLVEWAPPAGI